MTAPVYDKTEYVRPPKHVPCPGHVVRTATGPGCDPRTVKVCVRCGETVR